MSNYNLELDGSAIRELLKSTEMKEALEQQASLVCDRVGGTFEYAVHDGETRAWASIYPTSYEDILANNRDNLLIKALHK